MRFAPYVIAAALAGTITGCAQPYYYRDGYGPNYAYAPGYTYYPSRYSYSYYPQDQYYTSKWDYYRHYGGSLHPGPERYP